MCRIEFTQMQIVSEIFIHILFTFLFCFFFYKSNSDWPFVFQSSVADSLEII